MNRFVRKNDIFIILILARHTVTLKQIKAYNEIAASTAPSSGIRAVINIRKTKYVF